MRGQPINQEMTQAPITPIWSSWHTAGSSDILPNRPKSRDSGAHSGDSEQIQNLNLWTVAVDLPATGRSGLKAGAEQKIHSLDELAKLTKGKPIAIVVQHAIDLPISGGANGAMSSHNIKDHSVEIERYVIRNGSKSAISTFRSQGMAEDAGDLVEFAGKNYPSSHTAYFVYAHGKGNRRMSSDAGETKVSDFSHSLRQHLDHIGKKDIDVLVFDSCLMSQDGVASSFERVAHRLVASPELEYNDNIGRAYFGQNESAYVKMLLNNPRLTGEQLGRAIVAEANPAHNNRSGADCSSYSDFYQSTGTSTLSLLNLQQSQPKIAEALNTFGLSLQQSLEDTKNRRAIDDAINKTPRFGSSPGRYSAAGVYQKRDLKTFAELVIRAVGNGEISDPVQRLKTSAIAVLRAREHLVEAFYGSHCLVSGPEGVENASYDKIGGISVFLPNKLFRSPEIEASQLSPANRLARLLESKSEPGQNADETLLKQRLIGDIEAVAPASEEIKRLRLDIKRMGDKLEPQDYERTREEALQLANELVRSAWNQENIRTDAGHFKEFLQETYSEETAPELSADGWNQFTKALLQARD